ncbi:MAG: hypothetical protein DI570_16485 [Phenylobacterium zucineum]|nr:MAG: hypothetical protein DI570_16485 [Phenylobacterium zucineum]
MSAPPTIPSRWDGEGFYPLPRFQRTADEHYVVGEVYHLAVEKERSPKSHRQFFAIIRDVFDNLPESEKRWPTWEHLRKWALIKVGHCDTQTIVCRSKAEARRWANVLMAVDTYAVITIERNIVMRFTAKSIAFTEVGHRDFQAVKDAVFRELADLIAVDPTTLTARMLEAA